MAIFRPVYRTGEVLNIANQESKLRQLTTSRLHVVLPQQQGTTTRCSSTTTRQLHHHGCSSDEHTEMSVSIVLCTALRMHTKHCLLRTHTKHCLLRTHVRVHRLTWLAVPARPHYSHSCLLQDDSSSTLVSTVCTLLSATFLRACTLERLFVAHNPNKRRPKLPRPTLCGAHQSAARYGIDPSQHSPSERSPIAHVLISLPLAPNDAQPKSPPPNVAPSQKRAVQYFLDPVKRHPLLART